MRNRRKEQELKEQIIALRKEELLIKGKLKQKMVDLYMAMGFTTDQAVRMV